MLKDEPGFSDSITMLRTVRRLDIRGLAGIFTRVSILSNPLFKWNLRHGINSLKMLDALKLGLYLRLRESKKKSGPETPP